MAVTREIVLLTIIKKDWLDHALLTLGNEREFKEELGYQLEHFWVLFEQAIETRDATCLDPLLYTWGQSLTQSDLQSDNSHLAQFISQLLMLTHETICRAFSPLEVMQLTTAYLPVFSYALQKAADFEARNKMDFAAEHLREVQLNMERLDKSKSDFIAVAAHELKTPLTLIQGYAAMLQDTLKKQPGNQNNQLLLEGIHKGANRLHLIIDDMIDVSLIDNNLLQLNFQPIWIDRIFETLIIELQPAINERLQSVSIQSFDGSHESMFGDPERLMQVFRHLLTNAIKFTPDGGSITVTGRKLPGFIEIIISDTGIGIDLEEQAFIFEKFHRVGNPILHSTSKIRFKGGGPGLGLHIAKGVIEAHGGSIWVESAGYDENKLPGTTFHVMLPIRKESNDPKMDKLFGTISNI
ncbi:MAG: HAMP domain-containing histidine kinase [Anaerolineae bacterium]|nr:HAMP domain-containing histidine kinase [Anaerolineae bacterium]